MELWQSLFVKWQVCTPMMVLEVRGVSIALLCDSSTRSLGQLYHYSSLQHIHFARYCLKCVKVVSSVAESAENIGWRVQFLMSILFLKSQECRQSTFLLLHNSELNWPFFRGSYVSPSTLEGSVNVLIVSLLYTYQVLADSCIEKQQVKRQLSRSHFGSQAQYAENA